MLIQVIKRCASIKNVKEIEVFLLHDDWFLSDEQN